MHSRQARSLEQDVPEAARMVLAKAPVVMGLGVMENGYHDTADIVAMRAEELLEKEQQLLAKVRRHAARIPFKETDVLVVERIGKDISGIGFDTRVIGRRRIHGEPEFDPMRIRMMVVLGLTEAAGGNALGMGLADFTTKRLLDQINWKTTRTNVLHTGWLERAKLPIWLDTDRDAIWAGLTSGTTKPPQEARLIRISNTLRIDRMEISEALLPEAKRNPKIRILGKPGPMRFDADGALL
jgi:hypothetical protein